MINNDNTINVETKNNGMNKITKLYSMQLKIILQYISHLLSIILQNTHSDDK